MRNTAMNMVHKLAARDERVLYIGSDPGAGTLRGVFTETVNGERKFDADGWENAIQQVLAACKEFHVACGFPATPNDIEMRMKQGFSVFVMNWGDAGFKAVDLGREAAGR